MVARERGAAVTAARMYRRLLAMLAVVWLVGLAWIASNPFDQKWHTVSGNASIDYLVTSTVSLIFILSLNRTPKKNP